MRQVRNGGAAGALAAATDDAGAADVLLPHRARQRQRRRLAGDLRAASGGLLCADRCDLAFSLQELSTARTTTCSQCTLTAQQPTLDRMID